MNSFDKSPPENATQEAINQHKAALKQLKITWRASATPAANLKAQMATAFTTLCHIYMKGTDFQRALEHSTDALSFVETEELRVINFLCLYNLKISRLANSALQRGLELYPTNKVFKKYKFILSEEPEVPIPAVAPQKILEERAQPLPPAFAANSLGMLENMREEELSGMISMMKNPAMRAQMKQMHGRDLSDEELARMETMMTPQNLKMAMGMIKSNPDMLKNLQDRIPPNINPNFSKQPLSRTADQNIEAPSFPVSQNVTVQSQQPTMFPPNFPRFPAEGMMGGSPAESLLQNKGSIKMVLSMLKENPKSILEMLASMTSNQQIAQFSQMSERKLKIFASILYYTITAGIETIEFVRKYKTQLLFLAIAFFIYKFIL